MNLKKLNNVIYNIDDIDEVTKMYLQTIKHYENDISYIDNILGYSHPNKVNIFLLDDDEVAIIHKNNLSKFIKDQNYYIDEININNFKCEYFQFKNGIINNISKEDIIYYIKILIRDFDCIL